MTDREFLEKATRETDTTLHAIVNAIPDDTSNGAVLYAVGFIAAKMFEGMPDNIRREAFERFVDFLYQHVVGETPSGMLN